MNVTDVVVVVLSGLALIVALAWYFFAPQTATRAQVSGGRQTVDILVRGGYSPSLVRVTAGTPVRLRFDRQDNSDCTGWCSPTSGAAPFLYRPRTVLWWMQDARPSALRPNRV